MIDKAYDVFTSKKKESLLLEMDNNNYYNSRHQLIRVIYREKRFDLRLKHSFMMPNPLDHLVLVDINEDLLEDSEGIAEERLSLPPGFVDREGTLATIPRGTCELIDRRQFEMGSNPQNGQAGFSISNTNMFDPEKLAVAISPPLRGRDYTSLEVSNGDLKDENVGFFINKDGTILIKAPGGSITIGKEGIHIGGRLFTESSAIETGPLSDNTISDLIGSTIPTAGAAWPKLPNFGYIANIANAGMKFISIVDKAKVAGQIIDTITDLA